MSELEAPIRPTAHRHQHDEISIPERDRDHQNDRPARIETQTQIDRYHRRKSITEDQAEAGRRYFVDAYYSGRIPISHALVGERVDRAVETVSDRYVAAYQRRKHAMRALGGGLIEIAEWVCCEDMAAESYAIRRREHPRAGIAILRLALETLAQHYGLVNSR